MQLKVKICGALARRQQEETRQGAVRGIVYGIALIGRIRRIKSKRWGRYGCW